jgi:hypothetical protein
MTTDASQAPVLIASHGAVRVLTLNRPESLNSFNADMHVQLLPALEAAAADDSVRAVLITGAGRAFCAGQDLNDPAMGAGVDIGAVIERCYRPLALRVRTMPVPVVAAVNGVAAGAGANFALCCDVVIAARSATFIQAFSKIALVPDCGGTWLLPRLVGRACALALAMTGDKLPAEEAMRIGHGARWTPRWRWTSPPPSTRRRACSANWASRPTSPKASPRSARSGLPSSKTVEVNHPRSAFGAAPSRGRRWRTGRAGSAAAAWPQRFTRCGCLVSEVEC